MKNIELILNIEMDLQEQVKFLNHVIVMLENAIVSRRNDEVKDLELGFRIGEIYRMLHEFNGDMVSLNQDIKTVFEEIKVNGNSIQK